MAANNDKKQMHKPDIQTTSWGSKQMHKTYANNDKNGDEIMVEGRDYGCKQIEGWP